jgi:hypothetical protein
MHPHQQAMTSSLNANQSSTSTLTHGQAQQIYLNSLQTSMSTGGRPGSSNQKAQSTRTKQQSREVSSKSAVGTVGALGSQINQQNPNNSNQSIKRREKGRLIMQEWLTKSGQPTPPDLI